MPKQSERQRVAAAMDATIADLRTELAQTDTLIGVLLALKERLIVDTAPKVKRERKAKKPAPVGGEAQ